MVLVLPTLAFEPSHKLRVTVIQNAAAPQRLILFVPSHKVIKDISGATKVVKEKNHVWESSVAGLVAPLDVEILTGTDQLLVTLSFAIKNGAGYSSTKWGVKRDTGSLIEIGSEDGADADYNDMISQIEYFPIIH